MKTGTRKTTKSKNPKETKVKSEALLVERQTTGEKEEVDKKTLIHEREFKRRYGYKTVNEEEYGKFLTRLNIMELVNEGLKHNVKISSAMSKTQIYTLLKKEFKENLIRLRAGIAREKAISSVEEIEKNNLVIQKFRKVVVG